MNKLYLKQDKFFDTNPASEQITTFKSDSLRHRRENEILNGFVIVIGVVGFLAAFMLPRDLIYNRSSLENSFSNNSNQLVSSSLPSIARKESDVIKMDEHFHIEGFMEAGELLKFEFESFQPHSEVIYTLDFGNGVSKVIKGNITLYQYPSAGNYSVKLLANYEGEIKEVYKKELIIDEAIIVQSEAFIERE